jgi:hypothetical protein
MKKTITTVIAGLVLTLGLTFTSCKKAEKGDTGPAGTNGTNGNANIENFAITIRPGDWIYSSTYSEWHYNYYISKNSQSAVLGYIMSGNGKQALPYVSTPSNCRYTMATDLFQTTPYIQFQFTNFTVATTAPTYDQYLYLVIIPPAFVKPNVDIKDYNAVKKAYNLKD